MRVVVMTVMCTRAMTSKIASVHAGCHKTTCVDLGPTF
jgi:hypothetical protein